MFRENRGLIAKNPPQIKELKAREK